MIVIGWIPSQAVRETGNGGSGRVTGSQGWRQIEKLQEPGMKMNVVMKRCEEAERCLNGPLGHKSLTGEKVKQPSCQTEEALQRDPKSDYTCLSSKRGLNICEFAFTWWWRRLCCPFRLSRTPKRNVFNVYILFWTWVSFRFGFFQIYPEGEKNPSLVSFKQYARGVSQL